MNIFPLAILIMGLEANAAMTHCPARFPTSELQVEAGRIQPARLSFAYIHLGHRFSEQLLQGPLPKKVPGGWEIEYGQTTGDQRWLVCLYGGTELSGLNRISASTIQWWGKLDARKKNCSLAIREIKLPASLSDWSATATCK